VTAEIVLQIFRFGFLLLLWLFIFAAFRVVRADLFGGRAGRVAAVPPRAAAPAGRKRGQKGPRTLVVTAGPLTGTKITLGEQPILIGRADDSTLVLTDDFASSRHARLTNRGGQWYVEDLGSTNGTYLDQQRVQGPLLINPGQPIRIGQTALELRT
jgi:pSer/pThr/pTyr-binding forkhead associated (FHA) protein